MSETESAAQTLKATLLADLRHLQEVSVELEHLTGHLAERPLTPEEHAHVERLTAAQARLVDGFVERAGDRDAVQRYREATAVFQADLQALRDASDQPAVAALRDRIGTDVEAWVAALQDVIGDVVSQA